MQVFYGDNLGRSMEGDDKTEFFDFVQHLHKFANMRRWTYSPKNINQVKYTMQGLAAIKEGLFEGYYGTRKVSYSGEPTEARLVIQHNRALAETDARFRYVESLFIETADAERFRLQFKNLAGGRAMLEHVRQGGKPYDVRGSHITEMVSEIATLSRFNRASAGRVLEGVTAELVTEAQQYYRSLRENLKRMGGSRGYQAYFESWHPAETTLQEELVDSIKTMFVEQTLDSRIEAALPVLARLQQENRMKEADIFESWAEHLSEGTWSLPETPEQQQRLQDLMSRELIVGPDATNATEQLDDLVGDDILFDRLSDLASRDASANVWADTDVQARLAELGIQLPADAPADPGTNAEPDAEQTAPVQEGRTKELAMDLEDPLMSDEEFETKYGDSRAAMQGRAGRVQDRQSGEWYDPVEKFDQLKNSPEFGAQMRRMSQRESALSDLPRPNKRNQFRSLHKLKKQRGLGEQDVTEVSKDTLDRYVTKASDAHGDADFAARMSKHDPDKRSYHVDQKKTADKRRQGISRALDRMSRPQDVTEAATPASVSKVLRLIERHKPEWFDDYGIGEVEDTVVDMAEQGQFQGMSAPDAMSLVAQELESLYGPQGMSEASKEKTPGVALSKAYQKDFDGTKPVNRRPETALTGTYSKTGKPGGELKKRSVEESYPKHQDLSGISTEKLKAYLAKQSQQQVSGEGNQVKRVRAELQRRSQGVTEGAKEDMSKEVKAMATGTCPHCHGPVKKKEHPTLTQYHCAKCGIRASQDKPGVTEGVDPATYPARAQEAHEKYLKYENMVDQELRKLGQRLPQSWDAARMRQKLSSDAKYALALKYYDLSEKFASLSIRYEELAKKRGMTESLLDEFVEGLNGDPTEQGMAESIPDVDHMHGNRGINLSVADTRDLLDRKWEIYGDYKQWSRDVDRVNSELLDDNADYTTTAGGEVVSINNKRFAAWSNRNGNGDLDIALAKKYSQQDVAEASGCNATMEGEMCPKHGLAECGMHESQMAESQEGTALLARIKSLALLR
jgi:hypothetical protein